MQLTFFISYLTHLSATP